MNIHIPKAPSKGLTFGPSKTQAHLAKFCDINTMISRAIAGDSTVYRKGSYMDVSVLPETMADMLNAQIKAREAFEALPEEVRKRYNTPELFYQAALDPEQRQEFVKLGLAFVAKEDGPVEVKVVNPVSSKEPNPSTDSPAR